jgi:hypothetical protein
MAQFELAQLNIAAMREPLESPAMGDFVANLERINALADAADGFVWRLQDEAGDATGIKPFGDELEIINLTVWESIEALADFTYRSGHVDLLRRRREFFEAPVAPILCMWWIPEGTIPAVEDAITRLEHLRTHGPTAHAFTFRHRFEPGSAEAEAGNPLDTCPA